MTWYEILLQVFVAAGTLGGTLVALCLGLRSVREANQLREAQLRAQANSVVLTSNTLWTSHDGLGIWNASTEPIFHILALLAPAQGGLPKWESVVQNQVAGDVSEALFPGKDFKFGFSSLPKHAEFDLWVRFTDARSNVWSQTLLFSTNLTLLAPQGGWKLVSAEEFSKMGVTVLDSEVEQGD